MENNILYLIWISFFYSLLHLIMLALQKGNNPYVRMETTSAYHKLVVEMSQHQPVFDTNRTYLELTSRNNN